MIALRPGSVRSSPGADRVLMVLPFLARICSHLFDEMSRRTVRLARRLTFRGLCRRTTEKNPPSREQEAQRHDDRLIRPAIAPGPASGPATFSTTRTPTPPAAASAPLPRRVAAALHPWRKP